MIRKGVIITKLVVRGDEREDVTMEFEKGVNIVYGPSDTGKTYLFELIDFMFGAKKKPKKLMKPRGMNLLI